jgi:hypothetical protein
MCSEAIALLPRYRAEVIEVAAEVGRALSIPRTRELVAVPPIFFNTETRTRRVSVVRIGQAEGVESSRVNGTSRLELSPRVGQCVERGDSHEESGEDRAEHVDGAEAAHGACARQPASRLVS